MKFESVGSMPQLKKEIIAYLFHHISRKTQDVWHKYKGEFKYENTEYALECECRFDNQFFTYRNMHIERKQIVLDVHEMQARGMLQ